MAGRQQRPVILFDAVCLLCSTFIHFVLDNDEEGTFDFAPLQSPLGQKLCSKAGLPLDLSTMVLIDEAGTGHVRSTGVLLVLSKCRFPYNILAWVALCLPRPLRDLGYKVVARLRYVVFGQDDGSTCRFMSKKIRSRFLDHAPMQHAD